MFKVKFMFLSILLGFLCFQQINGDGDKLKVTLFYESLCPACRGFITQQLYPAYPKIGTYIDLDLVPYGNIRRELHNGTWKFDCQHGPDECTINKFEACGLAKSDDKAKKVEFVYCVESGTDKIAELAKCASKLDLPASIVVQCALGTEGDALLAILGDKQNLLEPNRKYVPWLDFNYKHDEQTNAEALENFLKTVCSLLDDKPEVCEDDNDIPQYEYNNHTLCYNRF